MQRIFGIIGRNISYSFSKKIFYEKFKKEGLNNTFYEIFDIQNIEDLEKLLIKHNIKGLNVTIPFKEKVIPFLEKKSKEANEIGAVNTIKIASDGTLIGYNTDVVGFENSFFKYLKKIHKSALILGNGGAAKAVIFVLRKYNLPYLIVSRKKNISNISYNEIDKSIINAYKIIINCTPLGTYPCIKECPKLPFEEISTNHYLYDLVYNPKVSSFLSKGKMQGAFVKNGLEMLYLQAECSWNIWNK